ncbi:MAG: sialate O-acetylesterase [Phycisphaeraceae bacterium]|nr:sialate O-acetylesterase [Phycisphaeraceae bacterium]
MNNHHRFNVITLAVLLFVSISSAAAAQSLRIASIFGSHMVLQAEQPQTIWGWAAPGARVTVSVAGQNVSAVADKTGRWQVKLAPLPANKQALTMTVSDAAQSLTLEDIFVGELWLCGGQSNMSWGLKTAGDAENEIANADHPMIRLFIVTERYSDDGPQPDVEGEWMLCTPENVPNFSAVAYFFGRDLQRALDCPVGLIVSARGGSAAEAWVRPQALQGDPDLSGLLQKRDEWFAQYPDILADYEQQVEQAKQQGDQAPRPPRELNRFSYATESYNAMIAPLPPLAIAGVIWYQGEHNETRAYQYRKLFPVVINDWRAQWQRPDLPFLFVQLPNFRDHLEEPADATRAELREAQAMALKLPHTAMVVTIDVGEAKNNHPKNKQAIGHRLTLAALGTVYGKDIAYQSPMVRDVQFNGPQVRVTFEHAAGGLVNTAEGPLQGFAVAGEDRVFHWAEASIDGDSVILQSKDVPRPVAVRYAWADNPAATLANGAGLPTAPFRSDDWPGLTIDAR